MNKRNREQLRASVASDLAQGKRNSSATTDLLKQYAPLEGILTLQVADNPASPVPVEKSLAPHATVSVERHPAWHDATVATPASVASDATLEQYAEVKGELRVPNTVNFGLFPTLDPFAKAIYYHLFLLSHGFKRDTCIIGLAKLAKSLLMSQRKVQDTILYLEKRHLIKRVASILGGPSKGNVYQVMVPATMAPNATVTSGATLAGHSTSAPAANVARQATLAAGATNKSDDDEIKIQSSSKGEFAVVNTSAVEDSKRPCTTEEQQMRRGDHYESVRTAYSRITRNNWNSSDHESYVETGIVNIPVEKVVSVMEAVARRTPTKINSFRYFVKEILAQPDRHNRAWRKKQLEKIVRRIRDSAIGRRNYSGIDLVEDVKCACARERVIFDNDLFNELVR
jgi:hypothetical protein